MLIIIFTCEQMNILYYLDLTEKKMGGINSIRLQRQRSTVSEWKPIFPQTTQGPWPWSICHASYTAPHTGRPAPHAPDAGGHVHTSTHTPPQTPPWNNQGYTPKECFESLRIVKDALKDLKRNDLNKRTKNRNLKVNRSSEACGDRESFLEEEQGRES